MLPTTHALIYSCKPIDGKTPVVRRTCETLLQRGVAVHGFYKEEKWKNGDRLGYEMVSLPDGDRTLVAVKNLEAAIPSDAFVAPSGIAYRFNRRSFEEAGARALAIPDSTDRRDRAVIVIDEIGDMELMSTWFRDEVVRIFESPRSVVLFSVQGLLDGPESLPLVRQLCAQFNVKTFKLTRTNIEDLYYELPNFLQAALNLM